jgi:hypothetical protein
MTFLEDGTLPQGEEKSVNIPHLASQMVVENDRLYYLWWPQRDDTRGNTRKLLVIPASLREEVVKANHDDLLSAHFGINRTFSKMREKY